MRPGATVRCGLAFCSFENLVKYFTTNEIIRWPLPEEAILRQHAVFAGISTNDESPAPNEDDQARVDRGTAWWSMLQRRVTEHSIRVVAKYYRQIRLARLGELLTSSAEEVEEHICRMVADKGLWAKIDRPAGIVTLSSGENQDIVLEGWAGALARQIAVDTHGTNVSFLAFRLSMPVDCNSTRVQLFSANERWGRFCLAREHLLSLVD